VKHLHYAATEHASYGELFDFGKVQRDEGIAQVSSHNEPWIVLCEREAKKYIAALDTFTGEDIRFHCCAVIGHPKHPNAWGALINLLVKRGAIRSTGTYRQPIDSTSHARLIQVYRKT
jgi:intergrase/recombinase